VRDLGQKFELWGTFSVWDHVRPGAFLAEVVMYDKLVVPVPPDPEKAETAEDRAFAEEQEDRWKKEGWKPQRLRDILQIVGPVAEPVEWDRKRHKQWASQYKKISEGGAHGAKVVGEMLAGRLTGQNLLSVVPAKAAGAVAVCPFDSLEALKDELGITETTDLPKRKEASQGLPGSLVSAVVGRELLVPEDPERDEFYLLQEAVNLVQHEDWRTARKAYHSGMLQFVEDGQTDYDSVKTAVEKMAEHLEELDKLARRRKIWKGARRVFFFTQLATQTASAPINPFAAAQVAATIGQYTTTEVLGDPASPYGAGPAGALLLDAQRKLGLTLKGARQPPRGLLKRKLGGRARG
jgi:hypothetical protein